MLPKYIWGILWASTALASQVPTVCLVTSYQLLCADFYVRTIDRCITNSLATDIFVKDKEICYVVYPDRCISADFCPQAQVYLKLYALSSGTRWVQLTLLNYSVLFTLHYAVLSLNLCCDTKRFAVTPKDF